MGNNTNTPRVATKIQNELDYTMPFGDTLINCLNAKEYKVNIDKNICDFSKQSEKIGKIICNFKWDLDSCTKKAKVYQKVDRDEITFRCSKHSNKLDIEKKSSISGFAEDKKQELKEAGNAGAKCQIIYQFWSELLFQEMEEEEIQTIKNMYKEWMLLCESLKKIISDYKENELYDKIRITFLEPKKLHKKSEILHKRIGEMIAIHYANSMLTRYHEKLDQEKEIEERKEEIDEEGKAESDIITLHTVSLLGEDRELFVQWERAKLEESIQKKLEDKRKNMVHEKIKNYDPSYERENCEQYKLEISSKTSGEFIKSMERFQMPNIKCLSYIYSKSLNTTTNTTMNDFFEKCVPQNLREFEFCINTNNKFEIQDGVDSILNRVTDHWTIRDCELEGNDVKNILQLATNVKTIEFKKWNIRLTSKKFKFDEKIYHLEQLVLNLCFFSASSKNLKNTLETLMKAFSRSNFKICLKRLDLIVKSESNISEEGIKDIANKYGLSLDISLNII